MITRMPRILSIIEKYVGYGATCDTVVAMWNVNGFPDAWKCSRDTRTKYFNEKCTIPGGGPPTTTIRPTTTLEWTSPNHGGEQEMDGSGPGSAPGSGAEPS